MRLYLLKTEKEKKGASFCLVVFPKGLVRALCARGFFAAVIYQAKEKKMKRKEGRDKARTFTTEMFGRSRLVCMTSMTTSLSFPFASAKNKIKKRKR